MSQKFTAEKVMELRKKMNEMKIKNHLKEKGTPAKLYFLFAGMKADAMVTKK